MSLKNEFLKWKQQKYLPKHRVKIQLNANYMALNGDYNFSNPGNRWGLLGQFELGI